MPTRAYGSVNLEHVENALADAGGPRPEVLGVINQEQATKIPPPPWETGAKYESSDARSFVRVPAEWTLRWLNPKWIDKEGWRYWKKVEPQDTRVQVLNESMIQVDNTIRRGGITGDILCWMYTEWVVSARKELARKTAEMTGTAEAKREELNEKFKRGVFGGLSGEVSHTVTPVNRETAHTV